ncbi:hypothetical protein HGI30_11930 [Paenibacillus albicereus]|uniref:Uncharacterized protein n=1 Tax=Paenibacillus albicereus TaxID=2726185 RepID=A0A6H2GYE2_9BACL|nr:hypothetical protein [Paenibacillus albicereus]QJC52196.1 hypothetical protein HGI30_11930 [Paenibacillus albicereus]
MDDRTTGCGPGAGGKDAPDAPDASAAERIRELGRRLDEALEAESEQRVLERSRERLDREILQLEREQSERLDRLGKEAADVERLSRRSWSSLWLRLTGDLDEQLELEQLEAERAAAEVKEGEAELRELREMQARTSVRLGELAPASGSSEPIRIEREQLVLAAFPAIAAGVREIDGQLRAKQALLAELREAIHAAAALASQLELAVDRLDAAAGWGTYDMLGGGMIATAAKHSRLDEAQEALLGARSAARRLHKELADVGQAASFDIPIGDGVRLGDYVLDGLFMDWHVQGKINGAREDNDRLLGEARRLRRRLETEAAQAEQDLSALRIRRASLLDSAV